MIPYDDLVVALTAWRARQGLPVAAQPVAAPRAQPARATPPVAPPRAAVPAAVADDFDGALVEDAPYDDAGDDYVLPLGGNETPGESTAIGAPPEAPKRW